MKSSIDIYRFIMSIILSLSADPVVHRCLFISTNHFFRTNGPSYI